ncbi:MAG: FAD-dependent oxidoreductase [Clostridia bacterium]|nr:FAD-dependent oxidoreductase [Clostridia bacterium]
MIKTDCVVVGGGPAGMCAALSASENGSNVMIIERDTSLGGILRQCIHNGFGLHYFKEELTGPEFAHKLRVQVEADKNITVKTNTLVTKIENRKVEVMGQNGVETIETKAVILAMGCRERTAGNISLCGTRPMGIVTAGVAQKMVNIDGQMVGKDIVILGSGDIGLIMARRFTLEGARVHAVLEVNKTSSGLRRNIMQCVEDFNIPLFFNTTIFEVVGRDRVEGVWYGQVDEKMQPIESTKKFLKCDTIVLSVGLIPEMYIAPFVKTSPVTKGAVVNEFYQTEQEWLFSCGNILHVHDLVDNVALEAKQAGKFASLYTQNKLPHQSKEIAIIPSKGFSYVLPSRLYEGEGTVTLKFRLREKIVKKTIVAKCNDVNLGQRFVLAGVPGEMMTLDISKNGATGEIVLEIN